MERQDEKAFRIAGRVRLLCEKAIYVQWSQHFRFEKCGFEWCSIFCFFLLPTRQPFGFCKVFLIFFYFWLVLLLHSLGRAISAILWNENSNGSTSNMVFQTFLRISEVPFDGSDIILVLGIKSKLAKRLGRHRLFSCSFGMPTVGNSLASVKASNNSPKCCAPSVLKTFKQIISLA